VECGYRGEFEDLKARGERTQPFWSNHVRSSPLCVGPAGGLVRHRTFVGMIRARVSATGKS
jgi:hypothetical protein